MSTFPLNGMFAEVGLLLGCSPNDSVVKLCESVGHSSVAAVIVQLIAGVEYVVSAVKSNGVKRIACPKDFSLRSMS